MAAAYARGVEHLKCVERLAIFASCALTLVACTNAAALPGNYTFLNHSATGTNLKPATQTFVLVADNQTQHLYGEPLWMRGGLAPIVQHSSVRPLQLDLYGQDLLKWTLQNAQNNQMPIIHLGDGLNFSCKREMTKFFALMKGATAPTAAEPQVPWVMTPGNHDGYFFGNEGLAPGRWDAACANADGPVSHAEFIAEYLSVIAQESPTIGRLVGPRGSSVVPPSQNNQGPLLEGISWNLVPNKPWLSYVTQVVNMTAPDAPVKVVGLLLDTSEYDDAPVLISDNRHAQYDAGETGNIGDDQSSAAEELLSASVPPGAPRPIVVIMGHHPFNALTYSAQAIIERLRSEYFVPLYVSAHNHNAQYFVNKTEPAKSTQAYNWLELNLGSVLDWVPEYREFSLQQDRGSGDIEILTPQRKLQDQWPVGHDADPAWEAKPESERYYLSILNIHGICASFGQPACQNDMQRKLMNIALYEAQYALQHFPTTSSTVWPKYGKTVLTSDAAIQAVITQLLGPNAALAAETLFAQQLQDFSEARVAADNNGKTYANYRLWQAIWASQQMRARTRVPDPNQAYFMLPREPQ